MDDRKYNLALEYLTPREGSFWNWDDRGAVVTWSSGATIAFRDELALVLGSLAANGLPPINAVLLLIAATRAYWAEDSLPFQHRLRTQKLDREKQSEYSHEWSELFARLDTVHQLPDELIGTPIAKAELASIVFESTPRVVTPEIAACVCEVFDVPSDRWASEVSENRRTRIQSNTLLIHGLWPLRRGLEGLTKESLLLRKETGLETEPVAAPVDFHVDQTSMRTLFQRLAGDDELGGLFRLARNLAAVVQLPRSISDSDELPLGGVSDLTNRGPLDRLLLSELAHDDLTLATRVALNEALYYRREIPPSFPPERRHVLIDSGLRMWGVPRVFATAVALSLAATGSKGASLSAYRASESSVVSVDLSTRDGLISHLGVLEPESQPGSALPEFFARISRAESPGDTVLVTTEAVLEDPEFQRELRDCVAMKFYIATVNRDGDFRLWSHSARGRKSHASVRLDLDQLLTTAPPKARTFVDSSKDPNLPAIDKVRPFPLRLPYHFNSSVSRENAWSFRLESSSLGSSSLSSSCRKYELSANEVVIVSASQPPEQSSGYAVIMLTRDHRLLLFDDPERGALQLGEGLPFGKCLGSWLSDDGSQSFAVIHRESESALYLLCVDLLELTVTADRLASKHISDAAAKPRLLGITTYGGVVFVIYRSMIEAFDPDTKELLDSSYSELPQHWTCGRYFWNPACCHNDAWFALSFDGASIGFQHVPLGKYAQKSKICSLYDRRGRDGAFGIDSEGNLINLTEQTDVKLTIPPSFDLVVVEGAEDGNRLLISVRGRLPGARDTRSFLVVEPDSGTARSVGHTDSLAHFDIVSLKSDVQTMRRFSRICIEDEKITLVSKRSIHWSFAIRENRLVMVDRRQAQSMRLSRGFEAVRNSSIGHSLSIAKWDDGSRAWIDSRGMLHLQSSDPSIPETTLVLVKEDVAVWTSDGRMSGSHYHIGTAEKITPIEVIETILEPFVALLR